MLHVTGEQQLQKWLHIPADGLRQLLLYNLKRVRRRWTQRSILMELFDVYVELLKQLSASIIAKLSAKTEA